MTTMVKFVILNEYVKTLFPGFRKESLKIQDPEFYMCHGVGSWHSLLYNMYVLYKAYVVNK